MSATPSQAFLRRNTIRDIKAHKGGVPVVALTAYDAPMARLLDPHCDLFIVGDSLGMVLYGMDSTLPVTLEMMIAHGKAVVKASQKACVVVDMPFGSYQASYAAAFNASARVLKQTGCQAVKIEGGEAMGDTIAFLSARGVPVMGHIALTPQYVNALGGYRYQGRNDAEREALLRDAHAVENAGAFAVVLEGVEESLAREITQTLSIPTIGIGASPGCDGQVLVTHDMLGLTPVQPKFVKQYGDAASIMSAAAEAYAKDVRARTFPTLAQCYTKKE
jgi:3-methyl-2-oxobutanoate hydroxymethyltransferase